MQQLTTSQTSAKLRQVLASLPAQLSGRASDTTGAVHDLKIAMGMQALTLVKLAFIEKSRGGSDAAGITWKPLAPETIAYGRRHPNYQPKPRGARPRGLLSAAQDARWRKVYAQALAGFARKGAVSRDTQGHAAAWAWLVLKSEGAQTVIEKFGSTQVEIGRDTGRLFNSLSPGIVGNPDQVLRPERGAVAVGTNVQYAEHFHKRRPLWPEDDQWPKEWTDAITDTLTEGVRQLVQRSLGGS